MRPPSLIESFGGSVMTRRPRGSAQISLIRPPTTTRESPHHSLHPAPYQTAPGGSSGSTSTSRNSPSSVWLRRETRRLHTSPPAAPAAAPAPATSGRRNVWRPRHVLKRVGKLTSGSVILLPLFLCLLIEVVMSKPQAFLTPEKITFQSKICQPVSATDLRRHLGAAFDDERMAADMASARLWAGEEGTRWTDGYQGDSPGEPLNGPESTIVETEEYLTSDGGVVLREDEMVHLNRGGFGQEEEEEEEEVDIDVESRRGLESGLRGGSRPWGEEVSGRRGNWYQRRRVPRLRGRNRENGDSFPDSFGSFEIDEFSKQDNRTRFDSFKFMRRKRRRRSLRASRGPRPPKEWAKGSSRKTKTNQMANKKSKSNRKTYSGKGRQSSKRITHSYVPLRLLLSGRLHSGRKLRKQLKKEFRQQNRKMNKPPPWQCKYAGKFVYMKENVFPRYVRDGVCATEKCFYRLYNCEPVQYTIKLLQRDEEHCVPIPTIGNSTTYEESWNIVKHRVTVACSCATPAYGVGKAKSKWNKN